MALQGEFAAVVVDHSRGCVVLVHDAVGLLPVFYSYHDGGLLFASHLADLLRLLPQAALDHDYLADFLTAGQATGRRTPFAAIQRLEPGETIEWSPAGPRHRISWRLADATADVPRDPVDREQRLRDLVGNGVEAACADGGPVWAELSGGLDSSTVAAVAASRLALDLTTVSISYRERPQGDEERYMHAVARHCGVRSVIVDGSSVLPFADPPGDFIGEPSALAFNTAQTRATDRVLAGNGGRILLTGLGGDEVLGGDPGLPFHLADSLARLNPRAFLQDFRTWRSQARSHLHYLHALVLLPFLRHLRRRHTWHSTACALPDWIDPSFVTRMNICRRAGCQLAPRAALPSRQALGDIFWLTAVSVANRGQRGSSYAIRHPLLHRPLLEFMANVPWEDKLMPGRDRILQRRAMKGVLPEIVRARRDKTPGTWALVEGLRRNPAWVDRLARHPHMAEFGMADAQAWRRAVHRARVGHTQGDRHFMTGVALETWFQQLRVFRSTAPALALDELKRQACRQTRRAG